jgi:hypothetical protein
MYSRSDFKKRCISGEPFNFCISLPKVGSAQSFHEVQVFRFLLALARFPPVGQKQGLLSGRGGAQGGGDQVGHAHRHARPELQG